MSMVSQILIHDAQFINAQAKRIHNNSWLSIRVLNKHETFELEIFMPYDTAFEYASAINACNDREAVSADENTNSNT